MRNDTEEQQLITKYAVLIDRFKNEVCLKSKEIDPTEDYDWWALSYGWFIANGVNGPYVDPDDGHIEPYYEAHRLATIVRYTFQYWTP